MIEIRITRPEMLACKEEATMAVTRKNEVVDAYVAEHGMISAMISSDLVLQEWQDNNTTSEEVYKQLRSKGVEYSRNEIIGALILMSENNPIGKELLKKILTEYVAKKANAA